MHALLTAAPLIGSALEGLRVYVAGSMRTRQQWGGELFRDVVEALRDRGALVHCPIEERIRHGLSPARAAETVIPPTVVQANLDRVFDADVVALLPAWEESGEASTVKVLAESYGVPVVLAEDLLRLS